MRTSVTAITAAALLAVLFLFGPDAPTRAADVHPAGFDKDIRPLLDSTCLKCHGPKKQKGHINFSLYPDEASALRQRKLWQKAIEQIEAKEMPPEDETQPTDAQRQQLLAWMKLAVSTPEHRTRSGSGPYPPT